MDILNLPWRCICTVIERLKELCHENSGKLGNYKIPVKWRETKNNRIKGRLK